MGGLYSSRTTVRYEGNDGDIKVISIDKGLRDATEPFNPEPAGSKNDADGARISGGRRKKGQRARYGTWSTEKDSQNFYLKVAILKKDTYTTAEVKAGDATDTTFNFDYRGQTWRLVSTTPEANN